VLTTCQPSTFWRSRERLPAAAAQPTDVRQSCSATDYITSKIFRMQALTDELLGYGLFSSHSACNQISLGKSSQDE
jgi:hypothetical protein